ncbi:hypothetical protein B0T19DRAFT_411318 [Cercophora scortea]|uniref:Uncharacterized protein n=1 Tax=Cercophora scortea TaxID=314031 RepID=A0AAE0MLI3_9PEZI|nr:hypothetical protein B0T19DRAFT_411318 [Cercophora scortea]
MRRGSSSKTLGFLQLGLSTWIRSRESETATSSMGNPVAIVQCTLDMASRACPCASGLSQVSRCHSSYLTPPGFAGYTAGLLGKIDERRRQGRKRDATLSSLYPEGTDLGGGPGSIKNPSASSTRPKQLTLQTVPSMELTMHQKKQACIHESGRRGSIAKQKQTSPKREVSRVE